MHPLLKDMTGQKFGKLTALYRVEDKVFNDGRRHVMWLCACDCGKKTATYGAFLRNGDTKSCGCLRFENKGSIPKYTPVERLMKKYQHGAKIRNLEWNLSLKEFECIISLNCHYCGVKPSKISADVGKLTYNGVDRVINAKGYTVNNTVPCCEMCNMMKGAMDYTEFISWLKKAGQYQMEKTLNA